MFNALMPGEHDYLKGKPMPGQGEITSEALGPVGSQPYLRTTSGTLMADVDSLLGPASAPRATPAQAPQKKRPIMNALSGYLQFAAPEQYEAGRSARMKRDYGNALASGDMQKAAQYRLQMGDFEGAKQIQEYTAAETEAARKQEAQGVYQLFSSMQPAQIQNMAMSDPAGFEQYTGMTSEEYLQTAQRLQQSGMTPEQFHQFVLEKAQAELGMDPTGPQEYMAPIEGVGPDGKPVYYQPSKTGQGRAIEGVMPIKQEADYASAADATGVRRYTEGPNIGQPVPGFETPRARSNGITIGADGTIQIGGPVDGLGYGTATKGQDAAIAFDPQGNPIVTPGPQQEAYNKARNFVSSKTRTINLVRDDIARARELVKDPAATGPVGAVGRELPIIGAITPGGRLDRRIKTIKANIGFDKLDDMRQNSPTGGALGNVTEKEIDFLQSVLGDLDNAQTDEDVDYVLRRIDAFYVDLQRQYDEAFANDYPSLEQTATRRAGANQQVEDLNELLQFMSPEERALFEDAQ